MSGIVFCDTDIPLLTEEQPPRVISLAVGRNKAVRSGSPILAQSDSDSDRSMRVVAVITCIVLFPISSADAQVTLDYSATAAHSQGNIQLTVDPGG